MINYLPKKRQLGSVGLPLLIMASLLLLVGGAFLLYYLKGIKRINIEDINAAEKIIGLDFTIKEKKLLRQNLEQNLSAYRTLRNNSLDKQASPAFQFNPILPKQKFDEETKPVRFDLEENSQMPENIEELAFAPISRLAPLIRNGAITSTQLTKLSLKRLKEYGQKLRCVITLTEETALEQARLADEEIASGNYRGPLHGIPYGAKDLLSTKGIKTTWGAVPYKEQLIDEDATVVKRLQEAGAVLVAKLSLGALAMGDVWYGGRTRNPWNPEQGSSGSSAGPAAATAAGLVAFAIGSETWGSIISPSTRCGVTGLRPTFGRVSRYGSMALSWSMDKIGPICRSVEDSAIVFHAIQGPDGKDPTVIDLPFNWDSNLDFSSIRVGYLKKEFQKDYKNRENDQEVLKVLQSLGIELIPVELPSFPVDSLSFILSAEAAAAFDDLTRNNLDDLLVRQSRGSWPNIFRQARFIPAVEYIQANRYRRILMDKMFRLMEKVDVYVAPSFGGDNLLLTNLTGHPAVVVPNGFNEEGSPTSITFIGNLYGEEKMLKVAKAYQEATSFHLQYTTINKTLAAIE
ncbi:MAG: amidase [Acidobacteriota bacterium]